MNTGFGNTTIHSKKGALRMYFWSSKFNIFLGNWSICLLLTEEGQLLAARLYVSWWCIRVLMPTDHTILRFHWLDD